MRVCVIGNSHVGPWKLAWDDLRSSFPHLALHFFAGPGSTLRELEVIDGALATRDAGLRKYLELTGGTEAIHLDDYDAFCIVGCGVVVLPIVRLYEGWRAESHLCRDGSFTSVSDACFEAAARGIVGRSFGLNICRSLAELTDKPIFLSPQPFPSDAILHRRAAKHAGWRLLHEGGDDRAIAGLFDRLLKDFHGGRLLTLPPPPATMSAPLLTHDRYSRDSRHLFQPDEAHRTTEFFHMNVEFGALCLQDLLSRVGSGLEKAAA